MKPEYLNNKQWLLYNLYFLTEHFIGTKFSKNYIYKKRNELYKDIASNNNVKLRAETKKINPITFSNSSEYLKNYKTNRLYPAIIKGGANDWNCIKKWNDDFFAENYADYPVEIMDNIGVSNKKKRNIETNMFTFIRELKTQKKAYLRVCRIIDDNPKLKNDLNNKLISDLVGGLSNGDIYYLFNGGSGTNTITHSEMPTTVFIQVQGQKNWTIYAPEERVFLNPRAQRLAYYYTNAKPNTRNNSEFPIIDLSKKYNLTTEEGDILIIPPLYWHYVQNTSSSIAIAYKHLDIPLAFKLSKVLSSLFFLRTKPTIIESILYKKKENYAVQVISQGK